MRSAEPAPPIGPVAVAVWLMDPAAIPDEWLARHRRILAPEEASRAEALGLDRLRHEYLLTRVTQRLVLSRHAPVDPAAWRFRAAPGGKPAVELPRDHRGLRFNVSHTRGLIAVAVCRDAEVGVDVEAVDAATDALALARRFFTPGEAASLLTLEGAARRDRFFQLWTLKEACLKARGTGLPGGLDTVSFEGTGEGALQPVPARDGAEGFLHVESARPTAGHVLGLAVARPQGPAVPWRVVVEPRWFRP